MHNGGRVLKDYIPYLKGYYYPKLYCKKLSNQKPGANKLAPQEEELYAECTVRLSLGDRDEEKYGNHLIFLIIPNGKLPVQMWWQIYLMPHKLTSTRVFIAAEKWMVRRTGVGGFISPQNGNLQC